MSANSLFLVCLGWTRGVLVWVTLCLARRVQVR
jgi:hypothetical protein